MRSNGKTYAVKERILEHIKNGNKFMYIRRRHNYVTRSKMVKLFSDISDKCEKYFGDYFRYSTEKGFYYNDGKDEKIVGYCTSVEDAYTIKSIPYNDVTIILFDEFMDIEYMEDEISKFLHAISTIVRERTNVEIFMLANTVSKYCPYFDLFKVDSRKLKQGSIAYLKHKNGASVAIEYCKNKVDKIGETKKHKYLGFDQNQTVDMILYGEWEYAVSNIKDVDGISWNSSRRLIPAYLTALNRVYEMSISNTRFPVVFVRKVNTQDGKVNERIKYNLSYDKTVLLSNKNGVVPCFGKVCTFLDDGVLNDIKIVAKCYDAKRIVFDTQETGTEFIQAFVKMI